MRDLELNKTSFYYANPTGYTESIDDEDNYTGETEITYTAPKLLRANISGATGKYERLALGALENYDKVLVTANTSLPIVEETVLWIDCTPTDGAYDYVVDTMGKTRNGVCYGLKKVNKSNGENS